MIQVVLRTALLAFLLLLFKTEHEEFSDTGKEQIGFEDLDILISF